MNPSKIQEHKASLWWSSDLHRLFTFAFPPLYPVKASAPAMWSQMEISVDKLMDNKVRWVFFMFQNLFFMLLGHIWHLIRLSYVWDRFLYFPYCGSCCHGCCLAITLGQEKPPTSCHRAAGERLQNWAKQEQQNKATVREYGPDSHFS